jgi:hypothetical protein
MEGGFLRTDADTSDETTGEDVVVGTTMGESLNDDTDAEDDRGDSHAELAIESIGETTMPLARILEFENRDEQTG